MNLSLSQEHLTVCQLAPDAPLPPWATGSAAFMSITRTAEELSIVCLESGVPADVKQERGWRVFKVDGPLDFGLTGVMASIATPLAQSGISLFSVATYNTDYVLVKESKLSDAVKALRAAGHTIRVE